jgi:hypothetical protein
VKDCCITTNLDLASVGANQSGERLHQRRFAGPVLADDRVNLTETDV